MSITVIVRRYPVAAYFILTFLLSWVGSFAIGGPKFLRGEVLDLADQLGMLMPMLIGPSIAGITMTAVVDGRGGMRDLFSRMGRWRVKPQWYVTILIFPLLILAALLVLAYLASPAFIPAFFGLGILGGLLAGFLEEIGWMGFAFPKMQLHSNTLVATLVLGLLHALWHIVADYMGASGARGAYWLPHFLAMMVFSMTAMRVILVWVYVNTDSLLLAQLMHASSTGFLVVLVPLTLSAANDTLFYLVYGVVLWGAAALVVLRYGRSLTKQPQQVISAHPGRLPT